MNTETQIRQAHARLAAGGSEYVKLSRIRQALPGLSRAEMDGALQKMALQQDVELHREMNQKTLTPADRAAAIRSGGEDKQLLWIER